jgi:hypothetical protein
LFREWNIFVLTTIKNGEYTRSVENEKYSKYFPRYKSKNGRESKKVKIGLLFFKYLTSK